MVFWRWCVTGDAGTLIVIDTRIAVGITIRIRREGRMLIRCWRIRVRLRLLGHCDAAVKVRKDERVDVEGQQ